MVVAHRRVGSRLFDTLDTYEADELTITLERAEGELFEGKLICGALSRDRPQSHSETIDADLGSNVVFIANTTVGNAPIPIPADTTIQDAIIEIAMTDETIDEPGLTPIIRLLGFEPTGVVHVDYDNDDDRPTEDPGPKLATQDTDARLDQVGGYALLGPLGRARDIELHLSYDFHGGPQPRPCVLKRLRKSDASDWEAQKIRFLEDARRGKEIVHPNLVKIYDFGEYRGEPYLVRELIDGMNLRGLSALAGATLRIDVVVAIALQIARALAYAHTALGPDGKND